MLSSTYYVNDNWRDATRGNTQNTALFQAGDTLKNTGSGDDGTITATYLSGAGPLFGFTSVTQLLTTITPSSGDTIVVLGGTYIDDNPTVNVSGLTIQGEYHGQAPSTRTSASPAPFETIEDGSAWNVSAANVSIDGFVFRNNSSASSAGIEVTSSGAGTRVQNTVFYNEYVGIRVDSGAGTALAPVVATSNLFSDTFRTLSLGPDTQGILIDGAGAHATITNNTFSTFDDTSDADSPGGVVVTSDGANDSAATISGNTFDNSYSAARVLGGGTIAFQNNTFGATTENTTDLLVGSSFAGSLTTTGDAFHSNGLDDRYIADLSAATTIAPDGTDTFGGVALSSLSVANGAGPTGLGGLYGIEDYITDGLDQSGDGLVRLKSGDVFLAQSSETANAGSLQRAVDLATSGNTIYVQAGTYMATGNYADNPDSVVQEINIDKPLTLLGPNADFTPTIGHTTPANAAAIILPGVSDPSPFSSTAINIVGVNSSHVTIEGFTIDGDNPSLAGDPNTITYNSVPIDASEGISSYEDVSNITADHNVVQNVAYAGIDFENANSGPNAGAATSNNDISDNYLSNLGGGGFGYGIGVLIYNNFYADVTNNVMDTVRVGVQTGNFSQANPGGADTAVISDNSIAAVRRGIYYNLHYSSASPFTVEGNDITAVDDPTAPANALWIGIFISSQQDTASASFIGNTIDGSAAVHYQTIAGYAVENTPTTGALLISGGSVSGVEDGVWVSNYVAPNNVDTSDSHVTIDDVNITASSIGVFVEDNPLNTTHPTSVSATITDGTLISTGSSVSGIGILVSGANASATISDVTIDDPTTGILVTGGEATITGGNIYNNTTGIEFNAGGNGSFSGVNFSGGIHPSNGTDVLIAVDAGAVTIGDGNAFAGTNYYIDDESGQSFDLSGDTTTTFGGFNAATTAVTPVTLANLDTFFGIEDKIIDYLDYPETSLSGQRGYVSINADNVFVAQSSEIATPGAIQRGVNVAPTDGAGTVYIQAGTAMSPDDYAVDATNGAISVANPLTVEGQSEAGVVVVPASGVLFSQDGFDVSSSNVTIEDLTIDGGISQGFAGGIYAIANVPLDDLVAENLTIQNVSNAAIEIVADAGGSSNSDRQRHVLTNDGAAAIVS